MPNPDEPMPRPPAPPSSRTLGVTLIFYDTGDADRCNFVVETSEEEEGLERACGAPAVTSFLVDDGQGVVVKLCRAHAGEFAISVIQDLT